MVVNHGNTYATAYGHLSRFAPGIHKGSRVHQGEVIAYSGNTGMSTGPHLHYEIRINKVQVNPLTVKVARGRMLFGKDLPQLPHGAHPRGHASSPLCRSKAASPRP